MDIRFSPEKIKNAVTAIAARVATEIGSITWRSLSEQQLWAELVACILSSQVRHEASSAAHERLAELGLLDNVRLDSVDQFTFVLREALCRPFTGDDNSFNFTGRYRFPRTKSEQIASTAARLSRGAESLSALLSDNPDAISARRQLVALCSGVGPKQASLFLRNIGFSDEVAVLDVYVVRYMERMSLVECSTFPFSSMRKYEKGEHSFQCHARNCGFTVAVLDTAVWVVMRTISGEAQKCQS